MAGSIHAYVENQTLRIDIVSDQGATLSLAGLVTDIEPEVTSGSVLAGNPALLSNMWAYGKTWYEANSDDSASALAIADAPEQRAALKRLHKQKKLARRQSATFAKVAQWIADVADDVSPFQPKLGWCSSCFLNTEHRKSNRPAGQMPVYVCQGCGSPTLPCFVVGCANMAVRERGAIRVPQYCAEHRHEVTGFEKANSAKFDLHDYDEFLKYEKPDFARVTRLTGVGVAGLIAATPLALLSAPAIGGAIGSLGVFGGLSGAAATSHGLAILGGGSLAAGGLGMAGGTMVVTAVGAAVGGTLGASVANAYLREDKSFRIDLLRPGRGGVPVIVANGFLTEGDTEKWGGWRDMVERRYPDSPVYRVRWGSKELRELGAFSASLLAANAARRAIGGPAAPVLAASDLAKNPWHVAKSRADKTGVILGDLLARTREPSYVLIGHSLGARLMVVAAEALGTKPGGPRIEAAHLLGAAVGAKSNWDALTAAVDGAVYGYHSTNDKVLKYLFTTVQAGQTAAGYTGFSPSGTKLVNVDVTADVKGHSEYQEKVELQ